jgi:hypothetical protein
MIRNRILDPDLDFLLIPDPGVKKAPDLGYAKLPTSSSYAASSSAKICVHFLELPNFVYEKFRKFAEKVIVY